MDFVRDAAADAASTDADPVLVTAAEKEEIGYEVPAGVNNSRLQEVALAHREEIYAAVQPRIEAELGRQVEMGTLVANIPRSSTVSVKFRTVDEPVVASSVLFSLGSDGSVGYIEPVDDNADVEGLTVRGLYQMAYRDRIAQLTEYLLQTYPQFQAMPDGYAKSQSMLDPMIAVTMYNRHGGEDYQKIQAEQAAVWTAYRERPVRTDEEWRAVFEEVYGDRELTLHVSLMLTDPARELTEEESRQIADDLQTNALFAGFGSWSLRTSSNLALRDGSPMGMVFHQQYVLTANRDLMNWIVSCWQDGGTVWSAGGADGTGATP